MFGVLQTSHSLFLPYSVEIPFDWDRLAEPMLFNNRNHDAGWEGCTAILPSHNHACHEWTNAVFSIL